MAELTWDDVEAEVEKVRSFFEQLPEEFHPGAADRLIGEIVIWGAQGHYSGVGILMEALLSYRETSLQVLAETEEEEGDEEQMPGDNDA